MYVSIDANKFIQSISLVYKRSGLLISRGVEFPMKDILEDTQMFDFYLIFDQSGVASC